LGGGAVGTEKIIGLLNFLKFPSLLMHINDI
jgi:hypothetical protein